MKTKMTRPSKIGRLPAQIIEQLNRRLDNREQNKRLVVWLNSLPETQKLLAEEFDGVVADHLELPSYFVGDARAHLNSARAIPTRSR